MQKVLLILVLNGKNECSTHRPALAFLTIDPDYANIGLSRKDKVISETRKYALLNGQGQLDPLT